MTWWRDAGWYQLEASVGRASWKVSPWAGSVPTLGSLKTYELSPGEGALEKILDAVHQHHGGDGSDLSRSLVSEPDVVARLPDGYRVAVEVKDEDPLSNARSTTKHPETKKKMTPAQQLALYYGRPDNADVWALAAPGFTSDLFKQVEKAVQGAVMIAVRTFEADDGSLGLAVLPRSAADAPTKKNWPLDEMADCEGAMSRARYQFLEAVRAAWSASPPGDGFKEPKHDLTKNLAPPRRHAQISRRLSSNSVNLPVRVRRYRRWARESVEIGLEPVGHGANLGYRVDFGFRLLARGRKKWMTALAPLTKEDVPGLGDKLASWATDAPSARAHYGKQKLYFVAEESRILSVDDVRAPRRVFLQELIEQAEDLMVRAQPAFRKFLKEGLEGT